MDQERIDSFIVGAIRKCSLLKRLFEFDLKPFAPSVCFCEWNFAAFNLKQLFSLLAYFNSDLAFAKYIDS